MQTQLIGAMPDDATKAVTHFFWSDGAWVSFNADTEQWESHGYVPHPTTNFSRFVVPVLTDAPRHDAEVAVDD